MVSLTKRNQYREEQGPPPKNKKQNASFKKYKSYLLYLI